MNYLPKILLPFLITFLITPLFMKLARRLDILDHPGHRKIHKRAVPLLGGGAIYCGLIAGLLMNKDMVRSLLPIIVGATIILIIGLIDDVRGLSAQFRFVVELIVVLILVKFGVCVSFLPSGFWGDLGEILVTVVWVVGVTNACNYLDGLDGLAAGSAILNLFSFSVILANTDQPDLAILAIILTSACLGFLPYNLRKAKIFLGDAGSTFLGFSLACIAISGNWAEDNVAKISIPMLVLGVPIFDMVFTTILRIKEGKIKTLREWLQYGGRDHFHHFLVDLGLHTQGAVIFIYLLTFSLGISAIMLSNDTALEAVLSLSQASITFIVVAVLIVVGKRRRSGWGVSKQER